MCDPITATSIGLSMAGSVAQFAGQSQQTAQYNAAAKQNGINANVAAEHQFADEGRKYIYDMRELQQEGYAATMKGRQAVGTSIASAGASGFDASSFSVGDIISSENQKTAQSMDNIRTKQDDKGNALRSADDTIEAQTQGRINSMPGKAAPSALGLAIGLGSDIAGGLAKSPAGSTWFNSTFGGN